MAITTATSSSKAGGGKVRLVHVCSECGTSHPKWSGQCSGCGDWNTLVEEVEGTADAPVLPSIAPARRASARSARTWASRCRPASASSTGCSAAASSPVRSRCSAANRASARARCSSSCSRRGRADALRHAPRRAPSRCGCGPNGSARSATDLWLLAETSLPHIVAAIDERPARAGRRRQHPDRADPALGSPPGSVVQVRGCAHRLVAEAKRRDVADRARRPRHQGRRRSPGRGCSSTSSTPCCRSRATATTRCACCVPSKHRFGPTNELGLFEMADAGLVGVPDASKLFLADRRAGVAGSAVVPTIEGQRPMLRRGAGAHQRRRCPACPPRRSAQGLDAGRLAMLLAVLERRARVPVGEHEVYASAVGGVRLAEPGARPRRVPRGRERDRATARCPPTWSCSARSGSAASCARSRTPHGGSPRRRGSGSDARSCPRNSPDGDGIARRSAPARSPRRSRAAGARRVTLGDALRRVVGGARSIRARHLESRHDDPGTAAPTSDARRAGPRRSRHAAARRHRPRRAGEDGRAARAVATVPRCWRSAPAGSSSTRRTARSACPSWRRWTARSSSRTDGARIARANVHLVPDPTVPTSETGTRHRTAERVARSLDVPVVSASARRWASSTCTPAAASTSCRRSAVCSTGPTRRCRRSSATRPGSTTRIANLTALEVEDVVTPARRRRGRAARRDGAPHRRRDRDDDHRARRRRPAAAPAARRAVRRDRRRARPRRRRLPAAGPHGRRHARGDVAPDRRRRARTFKHRADTLHLVGDAHGPRPGGRPPRACACCTASTGCRTDMAAAIADHFGELSKLQRATVADLMAVDGVDETIARSIKDTLEPGDRVDHPRPVQLSRWPATAGQRPAVRAVR